MRSWRSWTATASSTSAFRHGRALRSPETFFFSIRESLREARASSIGVVLPIRTLWGHESVCPYPDAEALALVAAEDVGDGVNSVGQTCPLHALPHGWLEAHERLQSIAGPLRLALAGRPLEEEEAV